MQHRVPAHAGKGGETAGGGGTGAGRTYGGEEYHRSFGGLRGLHRIGLTRVICYSVGGKRVSVLSEPRRAIAGQ